METAPIARRDRLDIVDAQVHVFITMDEREALAAMDALGIRGVMIDEVWSIHLKEVGEDVEPSVVLPNGRRRPDSPLAEAASLRRPDRFKYIQRVERTDPELTDVVSVLARSPGCRSLRVDIRVPEERVAFAEGGYDPLLRLARRYDLPLSILSRDTGAVTSATIARFPDVKFILDHCGGARSPKDWSEVLDLARFENVWMKCSSAGKAFGGLHPYPEVLRELPRAIDAFGVERLMWATDFTQNQVGDSWADLLYYLLHSSLFSAGERERFFAGTAREIFKWQL